MTKQSTAVQMAHEFAEMAINCAMRPGATNQYDCPFSNDAKVRRLSELYAAEVLGVVGEQARAEMQALESSLNTNEI